jgi:hypothetical protein
MSRYDLESKTAGIKIAVGWDRPLNTYFGIVTEDKDDDDGDSVIVWVCANNGEIQRPEDLQPALSAYAKIPADILTRLRNDRAETLDTGNSPRERHMQTKFSGL